MITQEMTVMTHGIHHPHTSAPPPSCDCGVLCLRIAYNWCFYSVRSSMLATVASLVNNVMLVNMCVEIGQHSLKYWCTFFSMIGDISKLHLQKQGALKTHLFLVSLTSYFY
jgi:hypothetical protein